MFPVRNFKRFVLKAVKQPGYAFGVGMRRLQAGVWYHLGRGASSLPESITLFLTYRCNLQCKMCGQWGDKGVTKQQSPELIREELTQEQLRVFIAQVAGFKPNITLFGGEPLLHPACAEVVRQIKEGGMHCLIITNGALLEEKAESLLDGGLDELNISLDGDEKLHDRIRGMPGLFSRILRGLRRLRELKEERGLKRPLVNLQCAISASNYRELDKMPAVARDAGADSLTFHHLIFLEEERLQAQKEVSRRLRCSHEPWEGFVFEPGIDVEELLPKITALKSRQYPFALDFYPNFTPEDVRAYYERQGTALCRCQSPWIAAYVFPNGDVRPCLNYDYSFGNIKHTAFRRIWNSKAAVRYRRFLKERGAFPACRRCTELFRY
ncbi:MAG: radical SAM protein [Candidatus Omnitrophica bacterium]|nr:radical SAM protein [Candidatus Omnitrophota bacterium]